MKENLFDELLIIRRSIHQNPEIGLDLINTKNIIIKELEKENIEYIEFGKGIIATIGKDGGEKILFRADMDALPMKEETDLPFKSVNNYAHCCGHDVHTTCLLGLLKLMKNRDLSGRIYALFQPDEEGGYGAKSIVDSGLFEKYSFDKLFALHLDAKSPVSMVLYGKGQTFASNTSFNITIEGKSSHGARAYEGIDPLNIGLKVAECFYSVITRELNVFNHNIFSITAFNSGNTHNVTPKDCNILATLRTYKGEDRIYIINRFKEIVDSFSKMYKIKIDMKIEKEIPPVETDINFTEDIISYLKEQKLDYIKKISKEPVIKLGSDDFAYFSEKIKENAYFFIGAGPDENTGYYVGQHNNKVVFNEKSILVGLELLEKVVEKYLLKGDK